MEALALGLSSGPACLASCGPVLMPVLAAGQRPMRRTGMVLATYLAGRFGGYLAFACAAWLVGVSLDLAPRSKNMVFAAANLAMAVLLALYGATLNSSRPACEGECPATRARRWSARFGGVAPLLMGFASGVSICPPFIAAGVRAAQGASLAGALFFFCCFFLGTSVWFIPSLGLGLLRRFPAAAQVARMMLFLLAAYYAYLTFILVGGLLLHG